jgi:beta-glucosidase
LAQLIFPNDFRWGAATSSYQIEGAYADDGKGESVWDRFTRIPYHIENNETADISIDHYHHMLDDVQLMKQVGLKNYRFSICWPRILPDGRGKKNAKGIDFYNRLVDQLLENGIQPNVTLNHWDFPQALQEKGGWLSRDSVDWFADYARVVFDILGDRVKLWSTHNEPWVIAFLGFQIGIFPPGICDTSAAYQVTHHLLMSHGKAVQVFRQGGYTGEIGIVLNLPRFEPASTNQADIDAFRRVYQNFYNLYLDPIFFGHYPHDLMNWLGYHQPKQEANDLDLISQPIDFLGVNHYSTEVVSYSLHGGSLKNKNQPVSAPGWGKTAMNWGINPSGLMDVLLDLKDNFNNPVVYITENGTALEDVPDDQGVVRDWGRINYLRDHLRAVYTAIHQGANVKGYYVWSLWDNFEWASGYRPRFGIIYVDYESLKRTPKQSALWYSQVVAENGITT